MPGGGSCRQQPSETLSHKAFLPEPHHRLRFADRRMVWRAAAVGSRKDDLSAPHMLLWGAAIRETIASSRRRSAQSDVDDNSLLS